MRALLDDPAVRLFGVTYLILVLKMVAVGGYTSYLRIRSNWYATPEDYEFQGVSPRSGVNEAVERARRAHQNDLENILPFFGVGFLYALTAPSLTAARIYFVGYATARVLHSVFYLGGRQPHRTVAFSVALLLMLGMVLATLVALA